MLGKDIPKGMIVINTLFTITYCRWGRRKPVKVSADPAALKDAAIEDASTVSPPTEIRPIEEHTENEEAYISIELNTDCKLLHFRDELNSTLDSQSTNNKKGRACKYIVIVDEFLKIKEFVESLVSL